MLKKRYNTLREVPTQLRDFYSFKDGYFCLDEIPEGLVDKDELNKIREDNINLKREQSKEMKVKKSLKEKLKHITNK